MFSFTSFTRGKFIKSESTFESENDEPNWKDGKANTGNRRLCANNFLVPFTYASGAAVYFDRSPTRVIRWLTKVQMEPEFFTLLMDLVVLLELHFISSPEEVLESGKFSTKKSSIRAGIYSYYGSDDLNNSKQLWTLKEEKVRQILYFSITENEKRNIKRVRKEVI